MSWEGLGTAEPTFESQWLDKTQWMRILIWTSLFLYALKAISVVAAEYSDFRGIRKAAAVNYDKQWEHFGNRTVRKDKPFLTKIFTFFVIFPQKHILWVLIGSSSRRQKRTSLTHRAHAITKTRLFKYMEKCTSKNWKFSDKKIWYFSYFCSKHRLWVFFRTASVSRNKKNNVYPCKPQFYYIKVGFKGVKII